MHNNIYKSSSSFCCWTQNIMFSESKQKKSFLDIFHTKKQRFNLLVFLVFKQFLHVKKKHLIPNSLNFRLLRLLK